MQSVSDATDPKDTFPDEGNCAGLKAARTEASWEEMKSSHGLTWNLVLCYCLKMEERVTLGTPAPSLSASLMEGRQGELEAIL